MKRAQGVSPDGRLWVEDLGDAALCRSMLFVSVLTWNSIVIQLSLCVGRERRGEIGERERDLSICNALFLKFGYPKNFGYRIYPNPIRNPLDWIWILTFGYFSGSDRFRVRQKFSGLDMDIAISEPIRPDSHPYPLLWFRNLVFGIEYREGLQTVVVLVLICKNHITKDICSVKYHLSFPKGKKYRSAESFLVNT